MSRLDALIQTLCPDGVEYKKIKEGYRRLKGTPITAGKMKEIDNPSGEIKIFAGGRTVINAAEKDIPNSNVTRLPAVLVQSRGVIDAIYYDKPFTFKNEMWAYTTENKISVKYLYYVLKSNLSYFRGAASGMGSLPQISLRVTEEFLIPVPPLPVQEEIVRILDTFTNVVEVLETELDARVMQYEYYRDTLFDGNQQSEQKTLGNIGRVCMCRRIFKEQTDSSSEVPFYKIGTFGKEPDAFISKELFEEYKSKYSYPKKGDVLFSAAGTIGKTVIFDGSPAYFQDSNIVWIDNDETLVLNKYLFYFYSLGNWATSEGGTIARLYNKNISNTSIPVPSLSVQKEIVAFLDRFNTLINDLKSGLPAEIAARRKQYEYYRDKLLTFPQKPPL